MPTEKKSSTRTRRGLFGRQITVDKSERKTITPKGEVTDYTRKRSVTNTETGKSKEKYSMLSKGKGNDGQSFSFKKVSKTKSNAPNTTIAPDGAQTTTRDIVQKSRSRMKQNGQVTSQTRQPKTRSTLVTVRRGVSPTNSTGY